MALRGSQIFAGVVFAIMLVIARFCWTAARDANKPLQPTQAAQPNSQREPSGSGPRG
jgi:hypothetical protein